MTLSDRPPLVLVLSCEKREGCSSHSLAQYSRICLRRREQSEGVCTLSCDPPRLLPLLVTEALVHAMALPSGQLLHFGRVETLRQDIIGRRVCRVRGCAAFPWHGRVVSIGLH